MNTSTHDVAYRGALLAELLLRGFGPYFIAKSTMDVPFDFVVGFDDPSGGLNVFGVAVKATEKPPGNRYPVPSEWYKKWSTANFSILLLVIDVKLNEFYFAWLDEHKQSGVSRVTIPITKFDPKDSASKYALTSRRRTLRSST